MIFLEMHFSIHFQSSLSFQVEIKKNQILVLKSAKQLLGVEDITISINPPLNEMILKQNAESILIPPTTPLPFQLTLVFDYGLPAFAV